MKKVISLVLSLLMVSITAIPAFSAEFNDIKFITDSEQIEDALKDKGIYEEGEDVVTVIEYKTENSFDRKPLLGNDFYSKKIGTSSVVDSTARYNNNYPAGSFQFSSQINVGWQANNTLGLSIEILSATIGYTLNRNIIETWTYSSPNYSYPINVKAYLNRDKEYFDIYEKDIWQDDYVGRAMISRETGYTIKVTRQ